MSESESPSPDSGSVGGADERRKVLREIQREVEAALQRGEPLDEEAFVARLPHAREDVLTTIDLARFTFDEGLTDAFTDAEDDAEAEFTDDPASGQVSSEESLTPSTIIAMNTLAEIEGALQDAYNQGVEADVTAYEAKYPELAHEIEKIASRLGFINEALAGEVAAAPAPTHRDEKETALGRYRLKQRIADHPSGTVYLATSEEPPEQLELMILRPEISREDGWKILREAENARVLQDSGFLTVREVGEVRGVRFIAGEHEEGVSLAQAILDLQFFGGSRPLDHVIPPKGHAVMDATAAADQHEARIQAPRAAAKLARHRAHAKRCLDMAAKIARILAGAHLQGRLHRGLSPDAVVVGQDGLPKVRWLGLNRVVNPLQAEQADLPVFWAPELLIDDLGRVDWRADVWGVGAILFALVRCQSPLVLPKGKQPTAEVFEAQRSRLDTQLATLPARWRGVLTRALAWRPDDRYQSCEALARDLESLRKTALTRPPTTVSTKLVPQRTSVWGRIFRRRR